MKKRILLFGFLFLVLILPLVFAEDNETELTEAQKVSNAYDCLKEKIDEKECENLGLDEKIFSVLSVGKCTNELVSDGNDGKCWPKNSCNLKSTSQAVMALNKAGKKTDDAEEWLLSQTVSPSELIWYLQIESPEETKCIITYEGNDYRIIISKEKKISSAAGSCLTLSEGDWWLRVAPICYGKEFEISCDKKFLTNLLFRKQDSSTIHVSEKTTESSAGGTNKEIIESFCFGQAGKCDYEGSLWATMVLSQRGEEVDSYLPSLITFSEDTTNVKFISDSFLYYLTDSYDFRNSLLLKQKASKYWEESGDRFYDTSVALLSIRDEPTEKKNSKEWLLDSKTMDVDGCWKGSISTTGFILYSIWPRAHSTSGTVTPVIDDCETTRGFCLGSVACREAEGTQLSYYCPSGMDVCCSKNKELDTCFLQGGSKCYSNEICSGGVSADASDLNSGEICCVYGTCTLPLEKSECLLSGGVCSAYCNEGEEAIEKACESYGDVCCVEVYVPPTSSNKLWIWILILGILILLLVIAYLYKDKLRAYWISFRKKGKSSPGFKGPFLPPARPFPTRGIPPRRMIPPSSAPPARNLPPRKTDGEMHEVLRKLKEMGR